MEQVSLQGRCFRCQSRLHIGQGRALEGSGKRPEGRRPELLKLSQR